MTERLRAVIVGLGFTLVTVGCAAVDVPPPLPGPTTTTTTPPAPPDPDVDDECDAVAGLRPDGPAGTDVDPDSYMAEIRERGRLRVGADIGTLQLGSVNPITGEFEGFDVDIARAVAAALFGTSPDEAPVELVGIRSADRVDVLVNGRVDLVASAFTINCARRQRIEFSIPYLVAGQKFLVRSDDPAESVEDLADSTVCVSEGSTAIANIAERSPDAIVETAPERGDCLVRLQQGLVDALATDDAILAGMAAQDPSLEVRGDPFSDEPYGLGLPADRPEWVRYVNAVLDELQESGAWEELYDRWLADSLGDADPPTPTYRD